MIIVFKSKIRNGRVRYDVDFVNIETTRNIGKENGKIKLVTHAPIMSVPLQAILIVLATFIFSFRVPNFLEHFPQKDNFDLSEDI